LRDKYLPIKILTWKEILSRQQQLQTSSLTQPQDLLPVGTTFLNCP
jgi:hypothetical protein